MNSSSHQTHTKPNKVLVTVHLHYFAIFREQTGKSSETRSTFATTASDLYIELQQLYNFTLLPSHVKVAINNNFCDWQQSLCSEDNIAFIPPMSGG